MFTVRTYVKSDLQIVKILGIAVPIPVSDRTEPVRVPTCMLMPACACVYAWTPSGSVGHKFVLGAGGTVPVTPGFKTRGVRDSLNREKGGPAQHQHTSAARQVSRFDRLDFARDGKFSALPFRIQNVRHDCSAAVLTLGQWARAAD